MRQCTKCGEEKELSEFNKKASNKDGLAKQCKLCTRAENKKWHSNSKNKEKRNAASREWRANNKERQKESNKKWLANNQENNRGRNAKYRAIKFSQLGLVFPNNEEILESTYGGRYCFKCGDTEKRIEVDHITPISIGGLHDIRNLQFLCRSCNAGKCNRDSIDYRPFPLDVTTLIK